MEGHVLSSPRGCFFGPTLRAVNPSIGVYRADWRGAWSFVQAVKSDWCILICIFHDESFFYCKGEVYLLLAVNLILTVVYSMRRYFTYRPIPLFTVYVNNRDHKRRLSKPR